MKPLVVLELDEAGEVVGHLQYHVAAPPTVAAVGTAPGHVFFTPE
jgi:hypothetical protein